MADAELKISIEDLNIQKSVKIVIEDIGEIEMGTIQIVGGEQLKTDLIEFLTQAIEVMSRTFEVVE